VPAGLIKITSRVPMGGSGWTFESLQQVELKPGQTLETNIQAGERPKAAMDFGQTIPAPKRIPGAEVKGVVLNPDGRPADGAEVALQVQNQYLALGRATLLVNEDARKDGRWVNAGRDGGFTLPLFELSGDVFALNEAGFAHVSLDQLKTNSLIR